MPTKATTSEDAMWVEVATGHPEYARELLEAITGITQPTKPDADGTWPILGPGNSIVGRIHPHSKANSKVLPVFAVPDVGASLATATRLGGSVQAAQNLDGHPVYEISDPAGHSFGELTQLDAFYAPVLDVDVDVVKLPQLPSGMSQPESGYRLLTRGNTLVAGAIESSFFLLGDSGPNWLVYLEVPDLGNAVVAAVELGCRVLVPPGTSPQGQYAVIEDPDQLTWGLGVTAGIPEAARG
jgi:predicted enzyme related to lactoylglutathione lyase